MTVTKTRVMIEYKTPKGIKAWAEEDRPREKLLLKGRDVLTNAELIAILIGSGTTSLSAIDVSKTILQSVNNDLGKLAKFTVKDLMQFKGIGEAKAISIVAALELGRRRIVLKSADEACIIRSSQDAYNYLKPYLLDLPHEEFWMLMLNRANHVIQVKRLSKGGVSGTVVDARLLFKDAVANLASGLIIAHNHPSGNIKPSQNDISLTKKLKNAGTVLDVNVLDHIIFADNRYYSFADEALM